MSAPFPAQHFERNPFATSRVRPGTIAFHFPDGQSPSALLEHLRQNHWMGEIIGPHGSGKSTLLHSFTPWITRAGRNVKAFTLHRGESQLSASVAEMNQWHDTTQCVIDGFEQLSASSQTRIKRICREQGCGLLLTSHEPTGLPTLYQTNTSVELVQSIVRSMQQDGEQRVNDADVAMSFQRQRGNVREVFFELYDIFEQRRPPG